VIKPLSPELVTLDANEAVASVAYRLSELFAIYPITPSTSMGESVDEWAARGRTNLWGHVPEVIEMQSEGGAAGALHGALQAGARACSFTASQGLLLMIPNIYKIVGELHPFVLHVTARTLATHALSIFGDHSDVMACRQTGAAMLCSRSVQEASDFAAVAHTATLTSRVPFIHFFDGFRTSHEIQKIALLSDDDLRALVDDELMAAARARGLTPDRPELRGTAQNPDVFFQAREAANPFHDAVPEHVATVFEALAARTGRSYQLFDYDGDPEATDVTVVMGSASETLAETAAALNADGRKTGVVTVRLYRPFVASAFLAALPATVKRVAVLDRTKEPGALGEPLFLDVVATLAEAGRSEIKVIGGRYGLGSKEFTPAMAKAVYDELALPDARRRFTVGIHDDVTRLSVPFDPSFILQDDTLRQAVFFGLGSDGTVGANKNSIKIIGESTDLNAQGYFVYDSKKSGAMTVSHLRFGPKPIRAPYLISGAGFVACHHMPFVEAIDILSCARPGATLLLNTHGDAEAVWARLPREMQQGIIDLKLEVYALDASKVARAAGMPGQINTVMQTAFFALSKVLPRDEAIASIKQAIRKTYGRKGEAVVAKNEAAVDGSLAALVPVPVPAAVDVESKGRPPIVPPAAPEFVQRVTARMMAGEGDLLPVSAFIPDGTWPVGTTKFEKRRLAEMIPQWDASLCIQCNKCVLVCPHAVIRANACPVAALDDAPEGFLSAKLRSAELKDFAYTLQVSAADCTGCSLCHEVCPARDKSDLKRKALMMVPAPEDYTADQVRWDFFQDLPEPPAALLQDTVKGSQFRAPSFEFSGACAGCGETPYIKLLTQLFGDHLVVANATGCSSIYGGNLPTTPYTTGKDGRGPAWSNSLFEDNAEYGLGLRAGLDQFASQARTLLLLLAPELPADVVAALSAAEAGTDADRADRRAAVERLRIALKALGDRPEALRLAGLADHLVEKSVWIVGGDGWAYDIDFGGLDHVLASNKKVRILVLDTEVYSNTGGQNSKSTPMGAVAKFAAGGKASDKKDMAMIAAQYGHVYVARVAMGAKDSQTVQAFLEAEAHPGPAIIIAYSHCIAHGIRMAGGLNQQKLAVDCGHWQLMRHNPLNAAQGKPITSLDSPTAKVPLKSYTANELRYQVLRKQNPDRAEELGERAQAAVAVRRANYETLAEAGKPPAPTDAPAPDAPANS